MPATVALITSAGLAAAAAASAGALQVKITHVALGAGKYTPTAGMTALVDQRETALVSGGFALDNAVTLTALFLSSTYASAQYDVGEMGFFIGDPAAGGTLFAVVSSPSFVGARRSSLMPNYASSFTLALSGVPSGSVAVTVDPSAGAGAVALANHTAASDPHSQYLLKAGGSMTGPLVLAGNAAAPLQAVPLQQLLAAFGGNFDANGKLSLPSGHIVKWGNSTTPIIGSNMTEPSGVYTFPDPFPTACLWAMAIPYNPGAPIGADDSSTEMVSWTAANLTVRTKWPAGAGGSNNIVRGIVYLAIGH